MKHLIFALICLMATGLAAQTSLDGGIQTGLMAPIGDFANKQFYFGNEGVYHGFGVHLGAHLDFNFTPQDHLRPHLTANRFLGQKQNFTHSGESTGTPDTRQNTYDIFQVGVDYVHDFATASRGAYLLAGLSFNQVKGTYKFSNYELKTQQSGRLGTRVGGGFTFNRRFSLEGSLTRVDVDTSGSDPLPFDTITWITISAVFRFGR